MERFELKRVSKTVKASTEAEYYVNQVNALGFGNEAVSDLREGSFGGVNGAEVGLQGAKRRVAGEEVKAAGVDRMHQEVPGFNLTFSCHGSY